jgi:hypothetical protein
MAAPYIIDVETPLEELPAARYAGHGPMHPIGILDDGRRGDMMVFTLGPNGRTPERVAVYVAPNGPFVTARLVAEEA